MPAHSDFVATAVAPTVLEYIPAVAALDLPPSVRLHLAQLPLFQHLDATQRREAAEWPDVQMLAEAVQARLLACRASKWRLQLNFAGIELTCPGGRTWLRQLLVSLNERPGQLPSDLTLLSGDWYNSDVLYPCVSVIPGFLLFL